MKYNLIKYNLLKINIENVYLSKAFDLEQIIKTSNSYYFLIIT